MNTIRIGAGLAAIALLIGSPATAANNNNGKGKGSETSTAKSASAPGKAMRLTVTVTGTLADTPTATASPLQVKVKTFPAAARKQLPATLRGSTIAVVAPLSTIRRNGETVTAYTSLKSGDRLTIKLTATCTAARVCSLYTAVRINASGA